MKHWKSVRVKKSHILEVLQHLMIVLLLVGLIPCMGQPVYGAYTAMDVSYSVDGGGFKAGKDTIFRVEVSNLGEVSFRTVAVTLGLPTGITPKGDSTTANITALSPGDKASATFSLAVAGDITGKTVPVTVNASGTGYEAGESGSASKTFYIPVGGGATSLKELSISNLKFPQEIPAGQSFQVDFDVENGGEADMSEVRIQTEIPEGLYLQGMGEFADSFAKGEKKHYTIRLFSLDSAVAKGYPIKISLSTQLKADAPKQVQYATVVLTGGSGGTVKTPLIMVDSYSYGGNSVLAGSDFTLQINLKNTSSQHLSNLKCSFTGEDGTFVPVGKSNSFFVAAIGPGETITKSLNFSVKPDAAQKTTALTVATKYEDGKGGSFDSSDIISIPVNQKMRLVVDDIVFHGEAYVGQNSTAEVQFYNMGKSVLQNLRVSCQGNFDIQQSNSYYVGNMDMGKSDTYSFNFTPISAGAISGTVVFSYEDRNGAPQTYEIPFSMEAMEMPPMDPGDMPPVDPNEGKAGLTKSIVIGGVILLLIVATSVFFKIRKKKKEKQLEIEDSLD